MSGTTKPRLHVLRTKEALPQLEVGRKKIAYAIAALLATVSVLLYAVVLPPSRWESGSLFFALMCLGFFGLLAAVSVRSTSSLDPSDAVAFVALVFLGPVPAVLILAVPDLTLWLFTRFRLKALIFNLVGFGFSVACASLVLLAFGIQPPAAGLSPESTPALVVAGFTLMLTALVMRALLDLSDLSALNTTIEELRTTWTWLEVPVSLGSAVLALLYAAIGMIGLAAFVPLVLVWNWMFGRHEARQVGQSRARVCADCALGIATVLELGGRQKRILQDTALHVNGERSLSSLGDFAQVMNTTLYASEHFDGGAEFPGVATAELIPMESRVLAVAQSWMELTYDKDGLADSAALESLKARAGSQFDPLVVAAAEVALVNGAVFFKAHRRVLESWPAPSRAGSP